MAFGTEEDVTHCKEDLQQTSMFCRSGRRPINQLHPHIHHSPCSIATTAASWTLWDPASTRYRRGTSRRLSLVHFHHHHCNRCRWRWNPEEQFLSKNFQDTRARRRCHPRGWRSSTRVVSQPNEGSTHGKKFDHSNDSDAYEGKLQTVESSVCIDLSYRLSAMHFSFFVQWTLP